MTIIWIWEFIMISFFLFAYFWNRVMDYWLCQSTMILKNLLMPFSLLNLFFVHIIPFFFYSFVYMILECNVYVYRDINHFVVAWWGVFGYRKTFSNWFIWDDFIGLSLRNKLTDYFSFFFLSLSFSMSSTDAA